MHCLKLYFSGMLSVQPVSFLVSMHWTVFKIHPAGTTNVRHECFLHFYALYTFISRSLFPRWHDQVTEAPVLMGVNGCCNRTLTAVHVLHQEGGGDHSRRRAAESSRLHSSDSQAGNNEKNQLWCDCLFLHPHPIMSFIIGQQVLIQQQAWLRWCSHVEFFHPGSFREHNQTTACAPHSTTRKTVHIQFSRPLSSRCHLLTNTVHVAHRGRIFWILCLEY